MALRRSIDSETHSRWARNAQLLILDSLMVETPWKVGEVAFHGGTSLHLSWRSPRFSEDLDFLISRQVPDIGAAMGRVARRVSEGLMAIDPGLRFEVRDKTADAQRLLVFHCVVTHPEVDGRAMVKAEFWRVDREYLDQYPVRLRQPMAIDDVVSRVQHPVPAATLSTAFCDKLTAFATRPRLKWRDVFDLWWIGTQTNEPLDFATVVRQYQHNVSAYQTVESRSVAAALRVFLASDRDEVIALAPKDLRPFLSESAWQRYWPQGVAEMVDYTRSVLARIADAIDAPASVDRDDLDLKRSGA